MIFGKGLGVLDHLLLRLRRRDDIEYMFASRTADLDAFGLNFRILQIKLGQTGSTRDNHGKPSF
jgi:hypothetical protein